MVFQSVQYTKKELSMSTVVSMTTTELADTCPILYFILDFQYINNILKNL